MLWKNHHPHTTALAAASTWNLQDMGHFISIVNFITGMSIKTLLNQTVLIEAVAASALSSNPVRENEGFWLYSSTVYLRSSSINMSLKNAVLLPLSHSLRGNKWN